MDTAGIAATRRDAVSRPGDGPSASEPRAGRANEVVTPALLTKSPRACAESAEQKVGQIGVADSARDRRENHSRSLGCVGCRLMRSTGPTFCAADYARHGGSVKSNVADWCSIIRNLNALEREDLIGSTHDRFVTSRTYD